MSSLTAAFILDAREVGPVEEEERSSLVVGRAELRMGKSCAEITIGRAADASETAFRLGVRVLMDCWRPLILDRAGASVVETVSGAEGSMFSTDGNRKVTVKRWEGFGRGQRKRGRACGF